MRILLINPAFPYIGKEKFPLGLGYIAAIALQGGHDVTVVDENVGDTVPYAQIKDFNVIGLTITTPAFSRAFRLITKIKAKKARGCVIIAGGHHPTFRPDEVMSAGVDIVVQGEADGVFPLVLEKLGSQKSEPNWEGIPGISYIDSESVVHSNCPPSLLPELDNVPFPAWAAFRFKKYNPMSVITSRGCPYKCSYCSAASFWHHTTRYHSVGNVLKELGALCHLYAYPSIKFQDSVFTLHRKQAVALLTGLTEGNFPFHWICESRADALDRDLVELMAQAKCKTIMLGLESGSQQVLDCNGRNMDVHQIIETCQWIKQAGIGLRASIIFGLPGETRETVEETLALLHVIQPNVTFLNLATIYPGCPLEKLNLATASHNAQWVQSVGGHGFGGQVLLPPGMTPVEYRKLADHMRQQIHGINQINWVKG